MRTLGLISIGVVVLVPQLAGAQSIEDLFKRGNEAYYRGEFAHAAQAYEQLVAIGVDDADVSYNLATAYAQQNQLGRAIQHFRRALEVRPGDDQASAGLAQAQTVLAQRRANAEGEAIIDDGRGFAETLFAPFREASLAIALLVLEAAVFVLLLLRRRWRSVDRWRRNASVALIGVATAGALVSAGLLTKRGVFRDGPAVVILDDRIPIREGPDVRTQQRSEAREGEPATLLEADDRFVRVRLSNGRHGWVEASAIGKI